MYYNSLKTIVLVALATCFSLMSGYAQDTKEPDFLGDIYFIQTDGTYVKMDREVCSIKTKTNIVPGLSILNSVKSFMSIKGPEAKIRVTKDNQPIQFIVKCKDNSLSPETLISVAQFEKKKKERRFNMGKTSILGGSEYGITESLPYEAEKYGESSYKITITGLEPGEYGIMVSEQDVEPGSYIAYRCFGID